MSSTKSPLGVKLKPRVYDSFMGLDASRGRESMETGQQQHVPVLDNASCDWRGQIVRDPPAKFRSGSFPVDCVKFFAPELATWAEARGSGYILNSDYEHTADPGWPSAAVPTATVFNRRVHMFAAGLTPHNYDGAVWRPTNSVALDVLRPAFGATVQRRLAVAGIIGKETEVHISRVDDDNRFPDDEAANEQSVLRAGKIDVANLLNASDRITALSPFEQDRLAIFTTDQVLIYRIDPNINNWTIEDRANIQVGCISHATVQQAGTDILFCGRGGVHSIRRSQDNGVTVFSQPMSLKITRLYRKLVRSVPDVRRITAVWDQDNLQYHIFFPVMGQPMCTRLTMTIAVDEEQLASGREALIPKWSTGTAFNARCGAFLAGRLVFGTYGGIWDVLDHDEVGEHPTMTVQTPILWHGDLDNTKESLSLIIQATNDGNGELLVEAFDDEGHDLGSNRLEINDRDDDGEFPDLPLMRQYTVPFQRRYRGLQLRFTGTGSGLLRITGFAVVLRN